MPYAERQNAGIVAVALNLREDIRSADFAGALKSGTTALLSALEGVASEAGSSRGLRRRLPPGQDGQPPGDDLRGRGAAFLVGDQTSSRNSRVPIP